PRPVAAHRAGHAPQHRDPPFTDHRKRLIRPVRLDLDSSDDCAHWPVLSVVLRARTPARRPLSSRRVVRALVMRPPSQSGRAGASANATILLLIPGGA